VVRARDGVRLHAKEPHITSQDQRSMTTG
jgi:hypothetical protein